MNDLVLIAAIAAVPPTLTAFVALAVAIINRRNTKKEIQEIHLSVNSRMDQLLKLAEGLARSEGHAEGQEQERSEARDRREEKDSL